MEAQGQVRYSSKISVQSRRSQISSCRSLQRPSWSDDHSLNKNRSLIEVMSLQGSKKSDLYEKILAQDLQLASPNRKSNPIKVDNNPFSTNAVFNPFKTCFKPDPQEPKRFSYEKDKEINHICLCYLKCKGETCPCYENLDQQCVNELCCKECIELKQTRKAKPSQSQTMEKDQRVFCTCKKTKCNKKYCSCFAMGMKCGIDCSCEDCLNCDKVERMEVEIVCVVDQEIKRMEMPESMDFQPFAFRYSYQG